MNVEEENLGRGQNKDYRSKSRKKKSVQCYECGKRGHI